MRKTAAERQRRGEKTAAGEDMVESEDEVNEEEVEEELFEVNATLEVENRGVVWFILGCVVYLTVFACRDWYASACARSHYAPTLSCGKFPPTIPELPATL